MHKVAHTINFITYAIYRNETKFSKVEVIRKVFLSKVLSREIRQLDLDLYVQILTIIVLQIISRVLIIELNKIKIVTLQNYYRSD
ncbi:hypothetical protein PUN28_005834 [Cardiocondyla obscurior]|uniref:Uncharacterized protein n=1 Tax=Cardiocondyla obscurior TaxID=286306 RepID=A0AAW2G7K3_9HYME